MVHFLNWVKILKESHDSYDTHHHFQIVNPGNLQSICFMAKYNTILWLQWKVGILCLRF